MAENEEIARLREALTFYANPQNWQLVAFVEPPTSAIKADGGKRARAALEMTPSR